MSQAAPQTQDPIPVHRADLPLSCPPPGGPLWSLHPRVYLPIEQSADGQAVCPYCGARYRLVQ